MGQVDLDGEDEDVYNLDCSKCNNDVMMKKGESPTKRLI
jgi:hypothetical protein